MILALVLNKILAFMNHMFVVWGTFYVLLQLYSIEYMMLVGLNNLLLAKFEFSIFIVVAVILLMIELRRPMPSLLRGAYLISQFLFPLVT